MARQRRRSVWHVLPESAVPAGGAAREIIDDGMLRETLQAVGEAGHNLRENRLSRMETWCGTCERCDHAGLCRSRE